MAGPDSRIRQLRTALGSLKVRDWTLAVITAGLTYVLIGVPTDLIDTPWFVREIPPTWWSYPVLVLTGLMAGLLIGLSSVSSRSRQTASTRTTSTSRRGMVGGVLSFFAVGCPVCNKIVLLALGSSGAVTFFEPLQPFIAAASLGLLGWALYRRLMAGRCVTLTGDACTVRQ